MKYKVNGFSLFFSFVADCFYYSCIHFLSCTPSPLSLDNVSRAGARDVNYRRIKVCIRAAAGVPQRKEVEGNDREVGVLHRCTLGTSADPEKHIWRKYKEFFCNPSGRLCGKREMAEFSRLNEIV